MENENKFDVFAEVKEAKVFYQAGLTKDEALRVVK